MLIRYEPLLIGKWADKHSSAGLWVLWGILSNLLIDKDIKYLLILYIEDCISEEENRVLKKPDTKTLPLSKEISDTEKDVVKGNDNAS